MSIIRWLPLQSHKSLNDLSHSILGIIKLICKFHQFYVVFDTYNSSSIKESQYSCHNLIQPLYFYGTKLKLKVLVQTNWLWATNFNKHELQKLTKEYFKYTVQNKEMEGVRSGYSNSDTKLNNSVKLRLCNF